MVKRLTSQGKRKKKDEEQVTLSQNNNRRIYQTIMFLHSMLNV